MVYRVNFEDNCMPFIDYKDKHSRRVRGNFGAFLSTALLACASAGRGHGRQLCEASADAVRS